MKQYFKEHGKNYLIIIFIAIIITSGLLIEGLPNGHDADSHLARAVGTGEALSEGQFPALITSNYANGFGYSWNIFYPPLVTYLEVILKIFVFTYENAVKLTILFSVITAGIAMYELVREITKGRKNVSLLASIMYICAPYLLVNIYTRFAQGEILVYAFFPIMFLGIYNLFNGNKKKYTLIGIGAIGILLSHNIGAIFAVAMAGIYVIFNITKLKDKEILEKIIINIIFIMLITSFFYLTLLETKSSANYEVFEYGKMATLESIKENAVYLPQILFGKMQFGFSEVLDYPYNIQEDMCFQLGLYIVVPLLFTPFVFKDIDNKKKKDYVVTLFVGIIAIVMTSTLFPYEEMPKWVSFIQYSWRFLFIATFTLTIIAAINLEKLFKKIELKELVIITTIILIYISPLVFANDFDNSITDEKFEQVDKLTEGTKLSEATSSLEYIPTNAFIDAEYLRNRKQEVVIQEGEVEIIEQTKDGSNMYIKYQNNNEGTKIELPYLYYPGYEIEVNGEKQEYYESDTGFIELELQSKEGEITVKYTGTMLARVSFIISMISLVVFIVYNIIIIRKYLKEKNNK